MPIAGRVVKLCTGLLLASACFAETPGLVLRTPVAEFSVLQSGYVLGSLLQNGQKLTLDDPAEEAGERLWINGEPAPAQVYDLRKAKRTEFKGPGGVRTQRIEVRATVRDRAGSLLEKIMTVESRDDVPNLVTVVVNYTNTGRRELHIDKIECGRHRFNAKGVEPAGRPFDVWTFQGASRKWGEGEVSAVDAKFQRPNFMATVRGPEGEGGGIPLVAFWTRRVGVATGHADPLPLVLSLPVRVAEDGGIETSTLLEPGADLRPGQSYRTPRCFLSVYRGDFYEALSTYAKAVPYPQTLPGQEAYKIAWCGWGFGFRITPSLMLGAIPKLKEFNIRWATLDDGWFQTYGDWEPQPDTFPGPSIQKMVEDFHRQDIRITIWWYPLAVEDGVGRYVSHKYRLAKVAELHPDWLILGKDGKHARFGRDLAVLCPALPEVQQYHKSLTEKFIRDWGFDGHKMDVVYTVPACYNPKHHHKRPEDSIEAMGEVYRVIYETTNALKPDSVTQICPCGTTPNIAWLPFMNQAVAADPGGSVRVRTRIKMYKALLGPRAAVTGDHVEYTADQFAGTDFASTIGLGGIPSSRFTWPGSARNKNYFLDDRKSVLFQKWFALYQAKMLSDGVFRNLYVYGYDSPEGYAVEKGGRMYYAFFAPGIVRGETAGRWSGEIELRGLSAGRHKVVDYVNGVELGVVDAGRPRLSVDFEKSLLLEVEKVR